MTYIPTSPLAGSRSGLSWGRSVANFQGLTRAAGINVSKEIERINDRVGAYLKRRAEARTPVRTGKAQASWAKSTTGSGRNRRVNVFNTARTPKGLYYLNFVEFGTRKMAPRRFFYRAQKEAERFQKKELEKLNRSIARRFNRGSLT